VWQEIRLTEECSSSTLMADGRVAIVRSEMDAAKIAREIASLPPEAQKEVIDFLAFVKARYVDIGDSS